MRNSFTFIEIANVIHYFAEAPTINLFMGGKVQKMIENVDKPQEFKELFIYLLIIITLTAIFIASQLQPIEYLNMDKEMEEIHLNIIIIHSKFSNKGNVTKFDSRNQKYQIRKRENSKFEI